MRHLCWIDSPVHWHLFSTIHGHSYMHCTLRYFQHWLDPYKVIKKQVSKGSYSFRFRVKLYPVSPIYLFEEATRWACWMAIGEILWTPLATVSTVGVKQHAVNFETHFAYFLLQVLSGTANQRRPCEWKVSCSVHSLGLGPTLPLSHDTDFTVQMTPKLYSQVM